MRLPARRSSRDVCNWDPFEEFRRTHDFMEQLFRAFPLMGISGELSGNQAGVPANTFSPLTDVMEEEDRVVVTTELPGIDKKDVELSVRDNVLVISASRGTEEKQEKEGYLSKERTFTRYHREIALPDTVTEDGGSAKLLNGVLTVTLPRVKVEAGKRIRIE
ncbi:MAG: Hsp20/alpha crystallin family protein [Methanosarcinaceae archaeon]|nr:Hsp20/alpha crystallin family protein [Methanosarcinaceae archaeon]MDD4498081.1 Hsp20/alpha crystallin family protein [Methanosarcinaceae archaeon]